MRIQTSRKKTGGFTLVEIMITLMIIGLLAAMAIPGMQRARENAANSRFAADLHVAAGAFDEFAITHRGYPADTTPGVMPAGLDDYLTRMHWNQETSLGGQWDWDAAVFGVKAGVSVYQPKASVAQMQRLDTVIDDGNLNTGIFRTRTSGYIYILEE